MFWGAATGSGVDAKSGHQSTARVGARFCKVQNLGLNAASRILSLIGFDRFNHILHASSLPVMARLKRAMTVNEEMAQSSEIRV
jgi:hypothetical protein